MAIMIMLKKRKRNELNMNFSVGVNMYSENVTSYWYLFRCSQRNVEANIFTHTRCSLGLQIIRDFLNSTEATLGAW